MATPPPQPSLRSTETSLLLVGCILVAAGLVFLWVITDLGRTPAAPELLPAPTDATHMEKPDDTYKTIFEAGTLRRFQPATNSLNPFFTAHFKPPPPLPVSNAPPVKLTRKIKLCYQGLFQTAQGDKRAYVMVGTNLLVGAAGGKVVADYAIANFDLATLTLKHGDAPPAVLPFRTPTEVEIPAD